MKKGRKIMFILIVAVSLMFAVLASLLLISGIFVKQAYLEPWDKNYSQKFDDPRIKLISHGLLAANGHNMQPWKIELDKDNPMLFYLFADTERLSKEVDPYSRQLMVTQGAFLEYVSIAGSELGYKTDIETFPDGEYDEQNLIESMKIKPVARVTLAKATSESNPLYACIFSPDTNRGAYKTDKLAPEQVDSLINANKDGGITVRVFEDKEDLSKISSYAIQSAEIEANVERVMKETEVIFRSNEYRKNQYRYGFSVEGQGTSGFMKHILQGLVTVFPSFNSREASKNNFIKSTRTSVDNTPAYIMIITKDNSRTSQVKSGILYSRLILEAHRSGLAMQPLSQSLEEYPEMSEIYKNIHKDYAPDGGTIQMLVRIGKPEKETPQSMRRDVMDLINNPS